MARIRTIKPEFWDDEKLSGISIQAGHTYIALWNFSDDYGVVKGSSAWLKSRIYPYRMDLTFEQFIEWLDELKSLDRIRAFTVDGEQFFYMPKFTEHQKINRPSDFRNAEPPVSIVKGESPPTHGGIHEGVVSQAGVLTVVREGKVNVREGKVKGSIVGCADLPKVYQSGNGVEKLTCKIVETYHSRLTSLSKVKVNSLGHPESESLRKQIHARIREYEDAKDICFWTELFEDIANRMPFLLGYNKKGWKASLHWITGRDNMAKVVNGNYYQEEPGGDERLAQACAERKFMEET